MIEWVVFFTGGLLGSSHCLGMCGPFVLSIAGGATNWRNNLTRQLLYTCGRIFTYSFIGALAGFLGWKTKKLFPGLMPAQAGIAFLAGGLLIYQGLLSAGVRLRRKSDKIGGACLASPLFATFLTSPGRKSIFLAGLLTGFLPCGLVYAFLALALGTGTVWGGMIGMGVFGVGTAPLMVTAGCGASLLRQMGRRYMLRWAAWCVVLTGVITTWRGFEILGVAPETVGRICPFCH